jgi:hypothetical protein
MPCPKCIALTKKGTSCKRNTCVRYPYCFQHQKIIEGLELKNSEINDAGLGLFATKNFPLPYKRNQDPTITYYSSKKISNEPNPNSSYVLRINSNQYLDSEDKSNYSGRYINSFKHHPEIKKRFANVRFTKGSKIYFKNNRYIVPIKQKKPIKKGDELYLNYGADYSI